jgi:hypothetical protein
MIGKVYYGQPKMASNNGFISDGFMNFGFLGLYIGKIFNETKKRPLYVIDETTFENEKKE